MKKRLVKGKLEKTGKMLGRRGQEEMKHVGRKED